MFFKILRILLQGGSGRPTKPRRQAQPKPLRQTQSETIVVTKVDIRERYDEERAISQDGTETAVVGGVTTVVTAQVTTQTIETQILSGRCYVIDGDTITIAGQNIRLFGIDAPELDDPYGKISKQKLMQLCAGQKIKAVCTGDLSHERQVAKCYLADGRDLSAEMVKNGMAIDWPKYSGGAYRHLEPDGVRKKLWRCVARQNGRMPANT